MEQNRKKVVGFVGAVLVTVVAAAVLFGLTGVLRDPAAPVEVSSQQVAQVAQPAPPASSEATAPSASDGGSGEVAAAKPTEDESFPQFDDEPTGS